MAKERESLENATNAKNVGADVINVLSERLNLLNKFFASRITGDNKLDAEAALQMTELIDNRQEFMDSTRLAFNASKPELMRYFDSKGLTTREINYCCLFLIGLRAKEIGNYLELRSHYNISSSIRTKLGMETNSTNLGIYLRKLMDGDVVSGEAEAKYTPRQLRGVILCEVAFDYLGWLIVACAFLNENSVLGIGVVASAILFLVMAVRALVLYRIDVMQVIRLASSMNQFSILTLMGTIAVALLFAESIIPVGWYPYIGYPAFIISQIFPLYGLYRYMR